jgi:phosphate transport system substrate-binding protein
MTGRLPAPARQLVPGLLRVRRSYEARRSAERGRVRTGNFYNQVTGSLQSRYVRPLRFGTSNDEVDFSNDANMKFGFSRRLLLAGLTVSLVACGGDGDGATPGEIAAGGSPGSANLTGAGATFPFPIYSRWFHEYNQQPRGVRVNYQSIGSGGGIRQFVEGTVDFGATDAPMTDEDFARVPGTLHLPTVLGSVAITYNLSGLTQPLRLDGPTIAAIFTGEVRRWNDARIAETNPGVALPNRDILPVHRSEGSGTTFVFADYLANVSAQWRERVGVGTSLQWPTGIGAKGNEGVTGQVRQTEGAIGYVEQVYARQNNLPMAQVRNRSGEFVDPSLEAIRAAAQGLDDRIQGERPDFRLSIVDSPVAGAYPISSWTYVLLRPHMDDCNKARALVAVWEWAMTEGGRQAVELHYAPLPEGVQVQVLAQLRTITCGADRQPAARAR